MKYERILTLLTGRPLARSPGRLAKALPVYCLLSTVYFFSLPACSSTEEKILKNDCLLQQAAQEALGEQKGAVVLMDAQTGRIRAMVNPEWALKKTFPPGSTFKIVTALAALESGKLDPPRTINCRGKAVIGGVSVRCHHPRGHGPLNLEEALGYSCNIYFYTIGLELGKEPILRWARELGWGQAVNLGLDEAPGVLREPCNNRELLDLAVGDWEGIEVTPLQLLRAYVAVAGRGELLNPYLADTPEKLRQKNPPAAGVLNLGASLGPIQRGLRRSVFEGTARQSRGKSYDLLAKTGTATIQGGWGTHAWFLGVAPAQKPGLALAVFLWRGAGYNEATQTAQKILEAWENLGEI